MSLSIENGPPGMLQIMCRAGEISKQAGAINLRKMLNAMTAYVQLETSFMDTMRAIINYASSFDLQYAVKLSNIGMQETLDDKLSANYPPSAQSTYVHYRHVLGQLVKDEDFLTLP